MNPIEHALHLLQQGKLVAIPTETVYGLAADARNPAAIAAVFQAKGRPNTNPLIVHIQNSAALTHWAIDIPEAAYQLAQHFWPGPLTFILKKAPQVSNIITAGQNTIAVRSPRHPLSQELLRLWQGGLVAPSANRYCGISPTSAHHVQQELGASVDFILDGGSCEIGIESSIIDLSSHPYTLLREGMITQQTLEACLGESVLKTTGPSHIKAPGQNKRHYAPHTPTHLIPTTQFKESVDQLIQQGLNLTVLSRTTPDFQSRMTWLSMPQDCEAYARCLYAKMRLADETGCDCIVIESVPNDPEWSGIVDRLTRAST